MKNVTGQEEEVEGEKQLLYVGQVVSQGGISRLVFQRSICGFSSLSCYLIFFFLCGNGKKEEKNIGWFGFFVFKPVSTLVRRWVRFSLSTLSARDGAWKIRITEP